MSVVKFVRAAAFAAHRHREQRRGDAEASPYINHPLAVANVLASEAGIDDIDVLCAAVLHDTVEDTATTLQELEEHFGPRVAGLVAELTDDKSLPKAERKRLQVEHAGRASHGARLIKLADKICNLRDLVATPPDWPRERRLAYFDWAEAVCRQLKGTDARLDVLFEHACAARRQI